MVNTLSYPKVVSQGKGTSLMTRLGFEPRFSVGETDVLNHLTIEPEPTQVVHSLSAVVEVNILWHNTVVSLFVFGFAYEFTITDVWDIPHISIR